MKHIKSLVIFLVLVMLLSVTTFAVSTRDLSAYGQNVIKSYKTFKNPVADGVISENEYGNSKVTVTSDSNAVFFSDDGAKALAPQSFNVYSAFNNETVFFAVELNESAHTSEKYILRANLGFPAGQTSWEANSGVFNEYIMTKYPNTYLASAGSSTVLENNFVTMLNSDDITKLPAEGVDGYFGAAKYDVFGNKTDVERRWTKAEYPCAFWAAPSNGNNGNKTVFEFSMDLQDVVSGKSPVALIPEIGYFSFEYTVFDGNIPAGKMTYAVDVEGNYTLSTLFSDTCGASSKYVGHIVELSIATEIGDADGDGKVNTRDAAILARHIAAWRGYEQVPKTCDTDNDGNINLKDSAILSRFLSGWRGYEILPYDPNRVTPVNPDDPEEDPYDPIPDVTVPVTFEPERLLSSIEAFEKEEIVEGQILFYGHSHYTRWRPLDDPNRAFKYCGEYLKDMVTTPFGNKPCINHGFGSSTLYDLCYYFDRAVKPWKPKALVITTYLNDYNFSDEDEKALMTWLLGKIEHDLPDCKVFVTDVPPIEKFMSESASYRNRWLNFNSWLLTEAAKFSNVKVIQMTQNPDFYTTSASLGTFDNIRTDLFVHDPNTAADNGTHFNHDGYEVLTKMYQKELAEILMEYDFPNI